MAKYTIDGVVRKTITVEADSLVEGVKLWQEKAGSGYPDGWEETLGPDDDPDTQAHGSFAGPCESCGRPILDGERHNYDEDGILWHKRCPS